jgi:hypothetical protein
MTETLRPCQTGTCIWLNEQVPSVHESAMKRCPIVALKMMEVSPEMDLQPTECPHATAYAWSDSQMASTQDLKQGEGR